MDSHFHFAVLGALEEGFGLASFLRGIQFTIVPLLDDTRVEVRCAITGQERAQRTQRKRCNLEKETHDNQRKVKRNKRLFLYNQKLREHAKGLLVKRVEPLK